MVVLGWYQCIFAIFKFRNVYISKFPTYYKIGWADTRYSYIIIEDEVFLLLKFRKRKHLLYIFSSMG